MTNWLQVFAARRAGWAVCLAGLAASLPLHVSFAGRDVFGRWSLLYAGVMLATFLALAVSLCVVVRRRPSAAPTTDAVVRNAGVALTGVAYLVGTIEAPLGASRLLNMTVFGSVTFLAPILEWTGLVLLAASVLVWAWRRLPARAHNLLLTGTVLVGLALVGEGAARLLAVGWPAVQGFPIYRHRLWFERYVELNSFGFRDRQWSEEKEDGVYRVFLLGDSYGYGQGIDDLEDRFGERLVQHVEQRFGVTWEILNLSHTDVHTLDQIRILEQMLEYGPDGVLLLYVFNDAVYLDRGGGRRGVSEVPRSLLDRVSPHRVLFQNSYAYQELFVRERLGMARDTGAPYAGLYADTAVMREHMEDLNVLWDLARGAGAEFAIVPFDIGIVASDALKERYRLFLRHAVNAGLPVWSLAGVFDGHSFDELSVNRLDRHPNVLANELAAAAAVEFAGREWITREETARSR